MPINLRTLCLVTVVLCNAHRSLEHEIPRRSFLSRRAIDGTRGRKYFDPNEDGSFDSYGSAGGQYHPYNRVLELSDIRRNVPGEPGIDYPAYMRLPQTGFTCEGRSRGYYADEEASCQVFHVCHDVLVSSFLCPIGSTFSQKLLTCDWWNKVDCSATHRYTQMNRNNYQIDDDEMIRNAYAMISLQSTEDVTKDGLVDPDNGARIIDYSILGGHTMSYTNSLRKITDYPSIDSTGNDLPSSYDDYSRQNNRDRIFNYDRYQKKETRMDVPVYRSNFKFENKAQSPYHALPVIGQEHGTGNNEFQDSYNESDGYTHESSYAPTVPTVTTTTRRFYSPTVPTINRPSTLAYNKLDLLMDSSDHLYTRNKNLGGPVTSPTITYDNLKDTDGNKGSQTDDRIKSSSVVAIPWKENNDDDQNVNVNVRAKANVLHHKSERKLGTNFRINVTDTIDAEDKVFRQQNDRPVINDNNRNERLESIEMEDSIGIFHAVNDLAERSLVRNQDSTDHVLRYEILTTPIPLLRNASHSSKTGYHISISKESNISVINETNSNQSIVGYDDTIIPETTTTATGSFEETAHTESFDDKTISLLTDRSWQQQRNDDDEIWRTTTISTDVNLVTDTTESNINETQDYYSFNSANSTDVNQNSSLIESSNDFDIPQPSIFFQPPLESFLINVPDETPSSLSTIEEENTGTTTWNSETSTTKIPLFLTTPKHNHSESSIYNGNVNEQSLVDYADEVSSVVSNSRDYPTERDIITEVSTHSPFFVTSIDVKTPVIDILPPIADYEDDFAAPDREDLSEEHSLDHTDYTERQLHSDSEIVTESPCHFSSSTSSCETNSVTTETAIVPKSQEEEITSLETTTQIPHQSISSGNIQLSEESLTSSPNESLTTIPLLITNENYTADDFGTSTMRTVIPRDLTELDISKETIITTTEPTYITTVKSHPTDDERYSNHPGSLKQTSDQHNYPYKVSLIAKTKEDSTITYDYDTPAGQEFNEEPISTTRDDLNDYDLSVELKDDIATILQPPRFSDINRTSSIVENDKAPLPKLYDSNMSMFSLLQLMADLLKLDRLPRPFATKDLSYNIESETSLNLDAMDESVTFVNPAADSPSDPDTRTESESVNFNGVYSTDDTLETLPDRALETDVTTPNDTVISEESSSADSNVQPSQKEEILEQLTEHFEQPTYDENPTHGSLIFDLPREQKELDFKTGLLIEEREHRINKTEEGEEETSTSTSTTTESEGEKSIVETEFVPSIGFSFDTDEDQEEYAEAVRAGLINGDNTNDKNKTGIVQVDEAPTTR